ncbi:MAG: hypothetical protein P8X58_08695 [Syntrophobacterales bacterium]|jgi:hypothetical protein
MLTTKRNRDAWQSAKQRGQVVLVVDAQALEDQAEEMPGIS